MTLIQNIIGISSTFMSVAGTTTFTRIFSMTYSLLVLFLAVQFFMSIVNITYAVVAANAERETKWDADLSDYISVGLSDLLKRKKNEDDDEDKADDKDKPQDGSKPASGEGLDECKFCWFHEYYFTIFHQ